MRNFWGDQTLPVFMLASFLSCRDLCLISELFLVTSPSDRLCFLCTSFLASLSERGRIGISIVCRVVSLTQIKFSATSVSASSMVFSTNFTQKVDFFSNNFVYLTMWSLNLFRWVFNDDSENLRFFDAVFLNISRYSFRYYQNLFDFITCKQIQSNRRIQITIWNDFCWVWGRENSYLVICRR